jgi:hypothetical protein
MARSLDDLAESVDNAPPVHPYRSLVQNHFYLDGWVSRDGGLTLLMLDALLFVPFMMFAFFYPMQALVGVAIVIGASLVLYEGVVLWRRHARRVAAGSSSH